MRWILVCILLAGCLDPSPAPESDVAAPVEANSPTASHVDVMAASPVVRFETNHGTIDLLMYEAWMPETAGHFLALVDGEFYDSTQVHRVIPGFVIQGGDPTGTGTGGSGTTVTHEFDERLQYLSGGVGLARGSDPDSGDSQWFITTHPATRMSNPNGSYAEQYGTYAMFGQVINGLDVVRTISNQQTLPEQDRPAVPVMLESATRIELDFDPAAYPLQPIEIAGHTVSMPLFQFDGHPFNMVQEVSGPDALEVVCRHGDGTDYPVVLHTEEPEPLIWDEGQVQCTFTAGDEATTHLFDVRGPL